MGGSGGCGGVVFVVEYFVVDGVVVEIDFFVEGVEDGGGGLGCFGECCWVVDGVD